MKPRVFAVYVAGAIHSIKPFDDRPESIAAAKSLNTIMFNTLRASGLKSNFSLTSFATMLSQVEVMSVSDEGVPAVLNNLTLSMLMTGDYK